MGIDESKAGTKSPTTEKSRLDVVESKISLEMGNFVEEDRC